MRRLVLLVLFCTCWGASSAASAQRHFDLGLRFNALAGDGEPTNDILSQGLFGRFGLSDRWRVGAGIDYSSEFDVERVAKLIGQTQDPAAAVVDAKGSSTFLRGWLERVYGSAGGRREWFWSVGAGIGDVEVEDASGPRVGGGTFTVVTDAGTELAASAGGGLRWFFARAWTLELALRADQHFADWKLVERTSGAAARVGDYLVTGAHIGVSYRFPGRGEAARPRMR